MLTYLNRMSAKGLHVTKLGRFKNTFDKNEDVRYIYAICTPQSEDYYSEVGRWEKAFEYKNLSFYRKKLPKDFVGIKKRGLYKKAMKEKLWLGEMLKNGLLLFGKAEDEYIFEHVSETGKTEYFVDYVSKNKNTDEYLYEKALDGFECVSPSTDGITYYFIKREGKDVVKGLKKLKTEAAVLKKRMMWSLFTACVTAAAFMTALFFSVKYRIWIIPCLIVGGSLTAVSFSGFAIFKALFKREKRRIRAEEEKISSITNSGEASEKPVDVESGEAPKTTDLQTGMDSHGVYGSGVQAPVVPGMQFSGAAPMQTGFNSQQGYGVQSPTQNGFSAQQGYGVQPPTQNGFNAQQGYGVQPPNTNRFPSTPTPKIDESDWQYVDEDDGDNEAESNGYDGVTYAPVENRIGSHEEGGVSYVRNDATYGQNTDFCGHRLESCGEQLGSNTASALRTEDGGNYRIPSEEAACVKVRFLTFQLISCLYLTLSYIAGVAWAVTHCVMKFILLKQISVPIITAAAILTVLLPVVIYHGIGAIRSVCREKRRNKKDF